MNVLVAPEVLQLLALAVGDEDPDRGTGDPHLTPGRYLRWMPSPVLGFPRRGFVLHRRPSPRWPWTKRGDVIAARVADGRPEGPALWLPGEGLDPSVRDRRGLRLTRPGAPAAMSRTGFVVDTVGAMIEILDREPMPRPDPASWVALRLAGPDDTTVTATAWASGGAGRDGREHVLSEATGRLGDLPRWQVGRDPGEDRVLIVHGGLVDAVEVHATGPVRLVEVSWLATDLYAVDGSNSTSQTGWEEVGRFLLPLDGDGTTYPSQPDADAVAERRLTDAAPRALPPWSDPAWPPAEQPDRAADAWRHRHLGGHLTDLRALLRDVLDGELADVVPQGSVRLTRTLHDPAAPGDADGLTLDTPAVPLLLAAALDAPLAHLLGLATVDRDPADDVPYDYVVSAVYPALWGTALLTPDLAERLVGHAPWLREAVARGVLPLVPPLPPHPVDDGARFFRAASVVTMVLPGPVGAVPAPTSLRVEERAVPGRQPLPAEAHLSWRVPGTDAFAADATVVVGATATRTDARGTTSLARRDPLLGHPLPYLVTGEQQALRDGDLRAPGPTSWAVQTLDLWGRWSAPATTTADIDAAVPPPPPSGLTARLDGRIDDAAGTVERLVVAFDHPAAPSAAAQNTAAPALDRFEVGAVPGDDAADVLAAASVVVTVSPDGTVAAPVGTAAADPLDGGGLQITVTVPTPPVDRQGHRRVATAAVRAVDDRGRASRAVAAPAETVEPAVPAVPAGLPGVQRASWPDADGTGWWTCRWTARQGERVQVLRASGVRLLAAAGQDRAVAATGGVEERAAHLRHLAVGLPNAFAPDHPTAHAHPVAEHAVALDGAGHDLTVVVTVPTGPTGSRAPWPTDPDAFTVVAPRRLDPPARPLVRARATDGRVDVHVTGAAGATRVRVWRTTDPALAVDPRRMRPLAPAPVEDGSARVGDDAVAPGTWYAYRVATETPDGRRGDPTPAVWVRIPG